MSIRRANVRRGRLRRLLAKPRSALVPGDDPQLASALPATDLVEDIAGSPYVDALPTAPWALAANGMLAIPHAPVLGLALDWERVAFSGEEG